MSAASAEPTSQDTSADVVPLDSAQTLLFVGEPARTSATRRRSPPADDEVTRLLDLAEWFRSRAKRRSVSEDVREACDDVAGELVALAEVLRCARAGRLPSGVLRVVGEQARTREARRGRRRR